MSERPQIACFAGSDEFEHRGICVTDWVERNQWLSRFAVLDELDRPEDAHAAYVSDARVLGFQLLEFGTDDISSEMPGVVDDSFFFEDVDARHG